jgi:hypothetical protein
MSVLNSRRLWTFILAQIVSLATLLVGQYYKDPFAMQAATIMIGTVQGVAAILITALTIDDSRLNTAQVRAKQAVEIAAVEMGTHPEYPVTPCPDQSGAVVEMPTRAEMVERR